MKIYFCAITLFIFLFNDNYCDLNLPNGICLKNNSINDDCSELIDLINMISSVPYTHPSINDSIYFSIQSAGKEIIPCLIMRISDSTSTGIIRPNFGGEYTKGDIAFMLIFDIMHIDIKREIWQRMNHSEYSNNNNGSNFLYYYSNSNNPIFINELQKTLKKWYFENEEKLVFIKYEIIDRSTNDTLSPGYYTIIDDE